MNTRGEPFVISPGSLHIAHAILPQDLDMQMEYNCASWFVIMVRAES